MQRYEADKRARGAEDVMAELLEIDGSYGEGGGQILRTSLSLAAITGRHIRIYNLRSKRRTLGLAAQHLTAVRAVAALCQAETRGDALGSQDLDFAPQAPVQSGSYVFDVAQAREGGSAGSVNLVLQAVLLPLALATGESHVLLRGGTHLPLSPSFDYIRDVWIKALSHFGITASVTLDSWGWFPIGRGQIRATIAGSRIAGEALKPRHLIERGRLRRVAGCAVAANLPAHIPQRMCDRATALLEPLGTEIAIRAERVSATCPGAGLFLVAEYENIACGFSGLGAIGKPSEQVAEEASNQLLAHWASGMALDLHLGDQILLPASFCDGPSTFSVEKVTTHLQTNAWVIEQFGLAETRIDGEGGKAATVTLVPTQANRRLQYG